MLRDSRLIATVFSLCALTLCPLSQARAQDLYVTTNRTIGGGNSINGAFDSITVGSDAANTAFPGVNADITGGSVVNTVNATNASLVNISGGTFGTIPTGSTITAAMLVQGGSTVNFSGATLNSFVRVGAPLGSTGPVSTFNVSGGTMPYLEADDLSVVNISGGNIAGIPGSLFPRGLLINAGNGIVNMTGGTADAILNYFSNGTINATGGTSNEIDFYYGGAVNFGGTASTGHFLFTTTTKGTANITGGTIGNLQTDCIGTANVSGGSIGSLSVLGSSTLNLTGTGLTVTAGAQHTYWDDRYFVVSYAQDFTVSGTLSDGTAINQTFTASTDYTANSTQQTFHGVGLNAADNLYVTTDQTISGIHSSAILGYDADFSNAFSPSVQIGDGTEVGYVEADNGSTAQITGGVIHNLYSGDTSSVTIGGTARVDEVDANSSNPLTVTGGTIQRMTVGYSTGLGTASLLGGSVSTVEGYSGTADIHGGLASNAILANVGDAFPDFGYTGVDFTIYGSNLSVFDPTAGVFSSDFTDGFGVGPLSGIWWSLSGTLADGSALSARYFEANSTTDGPARLTLVSSAAAPEPGSLALMGVGCSVLGVGIRRRRRA